MPQVFGADELDLIVKASSLWVEADFIDDTNEHEAALHAADFSDEGLPPKLPVTKGKQVWGQHLRSDPGKTGFHHWATVEIANRQALPNSTDFAVGGPTPRYEAKIHLIPKDTSKPVSSVSVWAGNDVRHFLDGVKNRDRPNHKTWPEITSAMQRGPKP